MHGIVSLLQTNLPGRLENSRLPSVSPAAQLSLAQLCKISPPSHLERSHSWGRPSAKWMMNHYLFYSDNDKLSLSGWGTFPLGASTWPSDRDLLPGLSLQPKLAGQKKGVWQTVLFSLLLNWGSGTPRGEGSGLNNQGKVMTGWGSHWSPNPQALWSQNHLGAEVCETDSSLPLCNRSR